MDTRAARVIGSSVSKSNEPVTQDTSILQFESLCHELQRMSIRIIGNPVNGAIAGYLLLLLLGILGTGIYVTLFGDFWYPYNSDSASYIEAARNLLAGNGLARTPPLSEASADLAPFLLWPPGFPTLIAGVSLLPGLAPVDSALLIPRVATALVPITLAFALRPMLGMTAAGGVGLLAFSSPLLLSHGFLAFSDVPFLILIVASFGFLARVPESPKPLRLLFVSGLLAGLSYTMRNAAISYFVAVATVFAISPILHLEPFSTSARRGVIWTAGILIAIAPVWLRNLLLVGSVNTYAIASTGGDPILLARGVLSILLEDATGSKEVAMLAWDAKRFLLLVVPSLALMFFALWRQWRGAPQATRFGMLILSAYLGAGIAMVVVAASKWFGNIDPRYVGQYTWVALSLFAIAIVPHAHLRWSSWRRAVALGIFAVLAFSYASHHTATYQREKTIAETLDRVEGLKRAARSLPDPSWVLRMQLARISANDRELLQAAQNLPPNTLPVSNASYIFRIETGAPVRSLWLNEIQGEGALEREIEKIRQLHRTRPIWLAFLPSNPLVKTGEDDDWRTPLRSALPSDCSVTDASRLYLSSLCYPLSKNR